MKLKVYGWTDYSPHRNGKGGRQCRMICAARSKAEVARIKGCMVNNLWNCCETQNPKEVKIAMADPLVIFWAEDHFYTDSRYERLEPKP
jgi:hypothetical protein